MIKDTTNWTPEPKNRFIAYFDIAGFKNRLNTTDGYEVINTILTNLHDAITAIETTSKLVKIVMFSDSILFISYSDTKEDASQIIRASQILLKFGFRDNNNTPEITSELNPFALRGVLAYGKFKADFDKEIYFGKPLNDAYLLEQKMQFFGAVIDKTFTEKTKDFFTKPGTINMFPCNAIFLEEIKWGILHLNYSFTIKKNIKFLDFLNAIQMDSRFPYDNPAVKVSEDNKKLLKSIYKTLSTAKSKTYARNTLKLYNLTAEEIKIIEEG